MDLNRFRVAPGSTVELGALPTSETFGFDGGKPAALLQLAETVARLAELQVRLFAGATHRLLVVLQAPDTAGKDGTIRAVFTGVNPQGVRIVGFGPPNAEELAHDYLWRVHRHTPATGEITVFNRSHYEDVLAVRVRGFVPATRWSRRYAHINDFERMLSDEGTTIVKVFLNVSKEKQAQRLQERIDDPAKHWKFRHGDLEDRTRWDDYRVAYQEMLQRTSTAWAPWYVVPADRNWYRNLVVAEIVTAALESLDLRYPDPPPGIAGLKVT